jgi:hypothetical protein
MPSLVINTSPPPVQGDWHQWVYPAGICDVELTGFVLSCSGTVLELDDFMVFPRNSSGYAPVGARVVLRVLAWFRRDIHAMGFTHVRLVGHRVSGASPMKKIDLTIAC